MDQSRRLQLHELLCNCLGSRNVYFQPPSTIQMNYPCIIYQRSDQMEFYADDSLYLYKIAYDVTVVDADPDSSISSNIRQIPNTSFDRHFVAENLNHDVFLVYY